MPPPNEDPTRARLIEAAGQVFADQGFHAATIRDICNKADANIAAVNYYFRDKMGLYVAVLLDSLCTASPKDMKAAIEQCKTPNEALRMFITQMLHRVRGRNGERGGWQMRIMTHEIAQPTAALDKVVEQVIAPNYAALRGILSRILHRPIDDDLVRLCAHSIVGQVIHYVSARPMIERVWPAFDLDNRLEDLANHITNFSLSGIEGLVK